MIEILPNWHPIFVHFTVALFTLSFSFFIFAYFFQFVKLVSNTICIELEIVARWSLWIAAFMTIFTVLAGFYAYNTVKHDLVSHTAMTTHRNWALITASMIFIVSIWSGWRYHKNKNINFLFVIALTITECFLLATAWHGGELVYRYGLGVLALPKIENKNTDVMIKKTKTSVTPTPKQHKHMRNHEH